LPGLAHHVAFLNSASADTREAFAGCSVHEWDRVTRELVAELRPDVVILHNTSRGRADECLPAVTLQYVHSRIAAARADATVYCSKWLADRFRAGGDRVCLQAVPRPARGASSRGSRGLRDHLVIGRLCTPQNKKWPAEVVELYRELAARHPQVHWEFVGCPAELRGLMAEACGGRAEFFEASWKARSRLWEWDGLLYHNPRVTESFGRTAAEAMRAGCIPIVDNRGGFREQVAEGCGFLCDDADGFAEAVGRILSPGVRRRMSRAGRARGDELFSLGRFGGELMRRFREAADGRRGGRVDK
jgi:glycosyltransferase involved in cell wall biosynthesis